MKTLQLLRACACNFFCFQSAITCIWPSRWHLMASQSSLFEKNLYCHNLNLIYRFANKKYLYIPAWVLWFWKEMYSKHAPFTYINAWRLIEMFYSYNLLQISLTEYISFWLEHGNSPTFVSLFCNRLFMFISICYEAVYKEIMCFKYGVLSLHAFWGTCKKIRSYGDLWSIQWILDSIIHESHSWHYKSSTQISCMHWWVTWITPVNNRK